MDLTLVAESDPILKLVTETFNFANPPVDPVMLTDAMFRVMRESRGIGLAAPQVGLSHRVFVMDVPGVGPRSCFNPRVVRVSTETERSEEGCLSFPDLWLKVARPLKVVAEFENSTGNLVHEEFENLAARCYLHETDHLNGVTFVNLVGPLALQQARKRRIKALRK